jgi:NACalpha-BTF3-like transcription factor
MSDRYIMESTNTEKSETIDNLENIDENKLNEDDIKNINLIMKKHSLDEETTTKIYLAFNKNVIGVLKYISNEIDNLKIICNQTEIDIEKARTVYYKCNKDVVESISFILEGKHENIEDKCENKVKEESIPLFDSTRKYKHIIEYGKDLLYDEEKDYLFDAESKDFFSTMKTAKTKIQELRCIVDSKDIIIQNQKKTMKKEKIETILNTYYQELMNWGRSQLEKWDNDEELKKKYNNKEDYKLFLEEKIKLKFANETYKYH